MKLRNFLPNFFFCNVWMFVRQSDFSKKSDENLLRLNLYDTLHCRRAINYHRKKIVSPATGIKLLNRVKRLIDLNPKPSPGTNYKCNWFTPLYERNIPKLVVFEELDKYLKQILQLPSSVSSLKAAAINLLIFWKRQDISHASSKIVLSNDCFAKI